jgi:hypothetical protein
MAGSNNREMDLEALGSFLRNRRNRVRPQDVGLAAGPRRRVLTCSIASTPPRRWSSPTLHMTLVQNPLAQALLGAPPEARGMGASFVYRWCTDSLRLLSMIGPQDLEPASDC